MLVVIFYQNSVQIVFQCVLPWLPRLGCPRSSRAIRSLDLTETPDKLVMFRELVCHWRIVATIRNLTNTALVSTWFYMYLQYNAVILFDRFLIFLAWLGLSNKLISEEIAWDCRIVDEFKMFMLSLRSSSQMPVSVLQNLIEANANPFTVDDFLIFYTTI